MDSKTRGHNHYCKHDKRIGYQLSCAEEQIEHSCQDSGCMLCHSLFTGAKFAVCLETACGQTNKLTSIVSTSEPFKVDKTMQQDGTTMLTLWIMIINHGPLDSFCLFPFIVDTVNHTHQLAQLIACLRQRLVIHNQVMCSLGHSQHSLESHQSLKINQIQI
jgi:hypothetical protein